MYPSSENADGSRGTSTRVRGAEAGAEARLERGALAIEGS